ncbi:pentapeptide repeat-containing protein [Synechococcus sp. PCC 7336]|uniref:pentapeptide repeat-containing protein n=1 Tax=Synechococcus sp. PCC 7336 TaxID=195250 RepID=UPI000346146B|nr:pentapeptide repeat-containing protein [Synechococcus sp. PCC 7336]
MRACVGILPRLRSLDAYWRDGTRCRSQFWRVGAIAAIALAIWIGVAGPVLAEKYDKEDLQGRNFAGMDISRDSFVKANLRGADFSNAYSVGTNMFGVNLRQANLKGADFTAATLDTSDLRDADLRGTIFEESLMWLTQFEGARIEGADFTDALLRSDTQAELCEMASGQNPVTGNATRASLDCD